MKLRQSLAQAARHLFKLCAGNGGRGQELGGEPRRQVELDRPDHTDGFVDIDRRLGIEPDAPLHDELR